MRPTERTVMFRKFFLNEMTESVDELINEILDQMKTAEVLSEEYAALTARLEQLYGIKTKQVPSPVSRDTIAVIAANILVSLLVIIYEEKHVIRSKAFPQIIRPK
jgi:hypothetical protein